MSFFAVMNVEDFGFYSNGMWKFFEMIGIHTICIYVMNFVTTL